MGFQSDLLVTHQLGGSFNPSLSSRHTDQPRWKALPLFLPRAAGTWEQIQVLEILVLRIYKKMKKGLLFWFLLLCSHRQEHSRVFRCGTSLPRWGQAFSSIGKHLYRLVQSWWPDQKVPVKHSSTSQLTNVPDSTEAGEGEPGFADWEEGHGTFLHLCIVWWLSGEGFFPIKKAVESICDWKVYQSSKAVALGPSPDVGKGRLFRGRQNKNLRTKKARGEAFLEPIGLNAVGRCCGVSSLVVG